VLAAAAIAAVLAYTRSVMVPFVLALLISYLVGPVVDMLQRRLRVPRLLGTFVALLIALGGVVLLVLLITTSVRGLLASASLYEQRLDAWVAQIAGVLDRFGIDLGQRSVADALRQLPVTRLARDGLGTAVNIVTTAGLVMIFVIFLVVSKQSTSTKTEFRGEIDAKVRRYLTMKVAISAVTGFLVGLTLWLFGLDLAMVFGITAFLLNFVPSIGSIIATLLPLPIALVQFDSFWTIAAVIAIPGAIQIIVGNGIDPLIMGEGLDLHPVTLLLALMFWGLLWGIPGMLLAAPLTAVLRLLLDRSETTRPVARLLAGRMPGSVSKDAA
jgi:AI-2 transport protein TqsA